MLKNFCGLVALILLATAGCKTDPYCQQAIGTLRAEKLQLENEYFAMKSRYEQYMIANGLTLPKEAQPAIESGGYELPYIESNDGPILEEIIPAPNIAPPDGTPDSGFSQFGGSQDVDQQTLRLAKHIKSVAIDQLAADNGGLKLLVRPLDANGDIMPVGGALKIKLIDPAAAPQYQNVASYNFSTHQVNGWVEDRPEKLPGIHIQLPWRDVKPIGDKVICEVTYQTPDRRVMANRTELVTSGTKSESKSSEAVTNDLLLLDELPDGLAIEFGPESDRSNDAAAEQSSNVDPEHRPTWRPNR